MQFYLRMKFGLTLVCARTSWKNEDFISVKIKGFQRVGVMKRGAAFTAAAEGLNLLCIILMVEFKICAVL